MHYIVPPEISFSEIAIRFSFVAAPEKESEALMSLGVLFGR